MTREEFEQAVRENAPPEILDEELAGLDEEYLSYLEIDKLIGGDAVIGYLDRGKGPTMYIGSPKSFKDQ
jgi:hypothetical protein